eukprot:CAMPEP_0182802096 /NCGR_PEP_ID=MMETSP0006_2-20121128/3300_1 /TAXON_ID=97485 /ORGANISM="Prymnesium parvum, Strain Texoma1" /LENGTH=66 /DNA_ID=CAMNT_0024927455 /DNA_START=704 /DNA_END=904 /DNA_ORIENTATION=-
MEVAPEYAVCQVDIWDNAHDAHGPVRRALRDDVARGPRCEHQLDDRRWSAEEHELEDGEALDDVFP